MSVDQLVLWETPKPPAEDHRDRTCACCGATEGWYAFTLNHTDDPDRWCLSKVLRRNHVISYARAIATAGEWPGRKGTGPARGWTLEQGYDNLREAIGLAKERGVTDEDVDSILSGEGVVFP